MLRYGIAQASGGSGGGHGCWDTQNLGGDRPLGTFKHRTTPEPSVRAHQVLPELDVNPLEEIHDDQLLRRVVSAQLQRKEKHIIKGGIKVQREG